MAQIEATKTSEIASHADKIAKTREKRRRLDESEEVMAELRSKTWAELKPKDKDAIAHAVALRLNLIKPTP